MKFIKDLTHRGEVGSSKKFWYNISCLTATIVLFQVFIANTMEDYYMVILYAVYLVTVGGFEVIPKMLAMFIEFKTGKGVKDAGTDDAVAKQKTDS